MKENDNYLFDIDINKDKYSSFERGEDGVILYFTFKNKQNNFLYLDFTSFQISVDENQKDYDCWLENYNISSVRLMPSCSIRGAVIFHGIKINENSNVLCIIEFNCNKNQYVSTFSKKNNKWKKDNIILLENDDTNDKELDDNNKLKVENLEEKLLKDTEKIDSFEEKYGVSIENLYIQISEDFHKITFTGELIQNNIEKQYKDFWINITFYNSNGKIITSRREYFYGFEDYDTFEIEEYNDDLIKKVDKIRIYVKGK